MWGSPARTPLGGPGPYILMTYDMYGPYVPLVLLSPLHHREVRPRALNKTRGFPRRGGFGGGLSLAQGLQGLGKTCAKQQEPKKQPATMAANPKPHRPPVKPQNARKPQETRATKAMKKRKPAEAKSHGNHREPAQCKRQKQETHTRQKPTVSQSTYTLKVKGFSENCLDK